MDDIVHEPAADWDNAPPAAIPAPSDPAGPAPLQAMALHDLGEGMVQVRYLDVGGKVFHAELPATTPMLVEFQKQLHAYWIDIEGAAVWYASSAPKAA